MAKFFFKNFCHSSFLPPKTTLAFLREFLHPRQTCCVNPCFQLNLDDPSVPTTSLPSFQLHNVTHCPDGIPAILLKKSAPELTHIPKKLFQPSYALDIYHTSWKLAHIFYFQKNGENLIHWTIVPFQSFRSSLKQWRPLWPSNSLPS